MKKKIGILADKLGHSLSPVIHSYWDNVYETNFIYKKFEIKKELREEFFNNYRKNNTFSGFNITIPYKEICMTHCDKISLSAKKIGSVNLIYKKNKIIYGDNTDVIGFSKCYNSLKIEKPKTVLVIGAGGAARAVLYFLNKKNIVNIDVFAPSLKRKVGLETCFNFKNFINKSTKLRSKYDLIINASSAGMVGKSSLNRNIIKLVKSSKSVIDIVYNPTITDLLKKADLENKKYIGGLKMLVEQAKPSFERWTGKKIIIDKELYKKIERYI